MQQQGLYDPYFEHDNCGAGFICNLHGLQSNDIIHKALDILIHLEHRGAVSADGKTGDGAGILIEVPHLFFKKVCAFKLPEPGEYAVGMVFLPKAENQRNLCIEHFNKNIWQQGLSVLGWREVPVNSDCLGATAAKTEPSVKQVFIGKKESGLSQEAFSARLYAARKRTEHHIRKSGLSQADYFYFSSLSINTLIYKGLLMPQDISVYYKDLTDVHVITRLALVHQRFSTNTFPKWELAQPFRYMCHNGEINTIRGNLSRMKAREELLKSEKFDKITEELLPLVPEGKSDSASMDMVLEFLLQTGRSLPEAMMMMVPEAWEKHPSMPDDKKAFYEYNACIMEPWDGPASIPFTDGKYIGALLDRNGLRPSRYTVTKDGYVIMSSETGVIDIEPENVVLHGRLEPGKMFLVDMDQGKIVKDEEIKKHICSQRPYRKWLQENLLPLARVPYTGNKTRVEKTSSLTRLKLFGYTTEDIETIITPMATHAKEAIGSMGTDTPLAVLSHRPQLLYNYFKQLFAQVTNPPLDGIREAIITDISLSIGEDRNIFNIVPEQCKKLRIQNPVISNEDLDKIKFIEHPDFKAISIPMLYDIEKGLNGLEKRLDDMVTEISHHIKNGCNIIILSDRNVSHTKAPIPALLACSFVHHSLKKYRQRSSVGIIIESAEPREPHHFAMLFGYGASAINPYLVNEIIRDLVQKKNITNHKGDDAIQQFNKAIAAGLIKIMNKIGISTLHSYRGSQIFEALGLNKKFINTYFSNTPSRIEGIGLYEIEKEIQKRFEKAFPKVLIPALPDLETGGQYRWRRNGEHHMFNPETVARLQQAVRQNQYENYETYARLINEQSRQLMTLRGMFTFKDLDPIPLKEVEPWTEIVKRFKTGAMSFGSISKEAHENLAIAMNRLGGKSNSGEGGEDPERFYKYPNGNWRNSAIKQVASGRFGVSINYLTNAREIQIKMAQGAKPGEGGQLPGAKVNPAIAKTRNSTPYVGLISPPPHHDIYSIEDLAQLIFDLKNANRDARINVKLVSEIGVGTIAAGVAKAKADVILISGYDGGTGASPLTSLQHAGLPWELGLAEAQQTLVLNDLRNRVILECDGQLKTGRDVAIACLLGAEEFGFSTAPLVASGCVMMRACHLNTCPVGIATQDPELRKNFKGTPEHVINFMYFVARELREIMASLGFRTLEEMVGQTQKLNVNNAVDHYKAQGIDLSKILYKPATPPSTKLYFTKPQEHNLENVLDFRILQEVHPAIYRKQPMELSFPIRNTDRATGAIISNEISKIHGGNGLPLHTLKLNFTGAAGQSFGAFATKGLTMKVIGTTNDYLGKGLSGATLIVKVPDKTTYTSHENVITGNVALYGATSGEAYINGIAGERFSVRNSGAHAVVEGVGDHGCEYMTGGTVVILGKTGRNFGAGMSGGIAYIYNKTPIPDMRNFNLEMIHVETPEDPDHEKIKALVQKHYEYTSSTLAAKILKHWDREKLNFIKIFPAEYKKALKMMAGTQNNAELNKVS
ncbi:glutamate synthase large subunit [Ascidiimonas aurantiaca]|uniref:glutamate synthase large subunit n=1 Tax=Ascidiimonas aurantiaca TaxID=1685432 RepID=UPI0030EE5382